MNERVRSTLETFLEPGEVLHHWVFGQSFKAGLITLYAVVSLFVAAFSAQVLFGSAGFGRIVAFWVLFAVILAPLATSVTTIFLFGLTDRRLIVARYRPNAWQMSPRFEKPDGAPQAAALPASSVLSVKVGSLKTKVLVKGPRPAKVTCGMRGQLGWQNDHVRALAEAAKS